MIRLFNVTSGLNYRIKRNEVFNHYVTDICITVYFARAAKAILYN